MPKVKKQHYVPKCYLRKFIFNDNKIFVFDKFKKSTFLTNIDNIACEKYFYNIPKNDDYQVIEEILSKIESDYAKVIDDVISNIDDKGEVVQNLKEKMAPFIMLQHFRTLEFRNFHTELDRKMKKAIKDRIGTENYKNYFVGDNLSEKLLPLEHARIMLQSKTMRVSIEMLKDHIWIIWKNETGYPLYTSDNPLVRRAHIHDNFYSYGGLASKGIELAFPLTPKYILVFAEKTYFKKLEKWDLKIMDLKKDDIAFYNSMQVLQSYRQIYCSSKSFNLAERICREHPDVCNPRQDRIIVNGV